MSFTYGFYNSVNHDRVYDAVQLSQLFDGLIADGVYETQGDKFRVLAGTGMTVTVGTGRAWFHHTWSLNDSLLPLTIDDSDLVLPRIDAIALEIDHSNAVRKNTIKIVKGLPAETPQKPEMADEETLHQYPLAYVRVNAGVMQITQANIENAVGTSATPFVTGIIEVMNIDMLVAQWTAQWNEYIVGTENEFNAWIAGFENDANGWMTAQKQRVMDWFQHMRDELDENQAIHLQNEIDDLDEKFSLTKSNNGQWINFTFSANKWVLNNVTGYYDYSLEEVYPTDNFDITYVIMGENTTPDMTKIWNRAKCYGYSESNIVTAKGAKPTIDIIMAMHVVYKTPNAYPPVPITP